MKDKTRIFDAARTDRRANRPLNAILRAWVFQIRNAKGDSREELSNFALRI